MNTNIIRSMQVLYVYVARTHSVYNKIIWKF